MKIRIYSKSEGEQILEDMEDTTVRGNVGPIGGFDNFGHIDLRTFYCKKSYNCSLR